VKILETFWYQENRQKIQTARYQMFRKKLRLILRMGGTHKRQISKPPTPHPPVSISANNHNRQSQRLS